MVVRATLLGLRIAEVPTTLVPDGRGRPPHLRSWAGRMAPPPIPVALQPRFLFVVPSAVFRTPGNAHLSLASSRPAPRRSVTFDVHTMLFGAVSVLVGCADRALSVSFARFFAAFIGLLPSNALLERLGRS
jgi:hypothetical protein